MLVLVCYDVSTKDEGGAKRLRRVAKCCLDFGQRVQNSVFECEVPPAKWSELRHRLLNEYDAKTDSLRFYFLGSGEKRKRRVEHHGQKPSLDLTEDSLIV
jgi:CRISPR-associated protein Cas2